MVEKINKLKAKQSGFTIVELLIVIVVIGILAAITIVAYSGITARANTTKAQTNAANTQKVAESFNADAGRYPASLAEFASGYTGGTSGPSSKLPTGISVLGGQAGTGAAPSGTQNLTSANGLTTVTYSCLTSCTNSLGGRITYWDFTTGAPSTTVIYVGSANALAGSTYVAAS